MDPVVDSEDGWLLCRGYLFDTVSKHGRVLCHCKHFRDRCSPNWSSFDSCFVPPEDGRCQKRLALTATEVIPNGVDAFRSKVRIGIGRWF